MHAILHIDHDRIELQSHKCVVYQRAKHFQASVAPFYSDIQLQNGARKVQHCYKARGKLVSEAFPTTFFLCGTSQSFC